MVTAQNILESSFITIEQNEHISTILSKLISLEYTTAMVFNKGKFVGVFDPYALVKKRIDITTMKVKSATKNVAILHSDSSLQEMIKCFFSSQTNQLPVIDKDKFVGVVHIHKILENISEFPESGILSVKDISNNYVSVDEDERLDSSIDIMKKNNIYRLPVMDKKRNIIGFVSFVDLYKKLYLHHQKRDGGHKIRMQTRGYKANKENIFELPIKNMLSKKEHISLPISSSVKDAALLMQKNKVLSVAVVKNNRPVSIISARDLIKPFIQKYKMQTQKVNFIDMKEAHSQEYTKSWLKKISKQYAHKIKHTEYRDIHLTIHNKEYKSAGKKSKFAVNARIDFSGNTFTSNKTSDWDLRTAVRKSLESLENELHKRHPSRIRKLFSNPFKRTQRENGDENENKLMYVV